MTVVWDHVKGLTEIEIDYCEATGAVYVCVMCHMSHVSVCVGRHVQLCCV